MRSGYRFIRHKDIEKNKEDEVKTMKNLNIRSLIFHRIGASYTVEAAGVFAIVLFTVLILLGEAFSLRAEAEGKLSTHEEVEYERHLISNIDEKEITRSKKGQNWSALVTLPVFRPENSLRTWSLFMEEEK